jgi:deazaflavin-dependent oxidoreductase (nitroreductase family)
MDAQIEQALRTDTLIDITTTGRKSGRQTRVEIVFHYLDGKLYISGLPGKRDWYANMVANPAFVFHLKQSMQADIPAKATPITDEAMRRQILTKVVAKWNRQAELEAFVQSSPLVEVTLEGN